FSLLHVSRQSPPRFILFPYTTLFRSSDYGIFIFLGVAAVFIIVAINRLLVWARTYISIEENAIVIEKNTVNRKKNTIGIASISKDRKSTRLNSSHVSISYAVFCLKKK